MKKVGLEALLVIVLLSAWGVFEFATGFSAKGRWYEVLTPVILAAVAVGVAYRWARLFAPERLVNSLRMTARWKLAILGALIAGCTTGGLVYLLTLLLELPYFLAYGYSLFVGLVLGLGPIAMRELR